MYLHSVTQQLSQDRIANFSAFIASKPFDQLEIFLVNQIDYLPMSNENYRSIHSHSFEQLKIFLGTAKNNQTSKIVGKNETLHNRTKSCKSERSCIHPVVKKWIDSLNAKNNSKPTEKHDSVSNLPKLSQTAISNTDLTVGVTTSTTTDITE